jgi:hypothetical protein
MKHQLENWRDTSWEMGGRRWERQADNKKVTISEVIDHLSAPDPIDINVSELTQDILPGGLPDWEYDRARVTAASLEYPIIIVKSAGQYKYILDGNHRLQKAINEKVENIKAKILDLDNPETPEVFKKMFGARPR